MLLHPIGPPLLCSPSNEGGDGFFIGVEGYLITNQHVIEDCGPIWGLIQFRKYSLDVIDESYRHDLALLSVNYRPQIQPLFNAIDLEALQNQTVYVSGFPANAPLHHVTITRGFLREASTTVWGQSGPIRNLSEIVTSRPIRPGNSGGPIFDRHGRIIGVAKGHLSILGNIALAIPLEPVFDLLEDNDITVPSDRLSRDLSGASVRKQRFQKNLASALSFPLLCEIQD